MNLVAVHAQLLGGAMDFHLLFKAFGPRATVCPPHLGTQHLPYEAQAGEWPRCPEKICDTKGQDIPSLGHAWPSLRIWPQFVSGTQE